MRIFQARLSDVATSLALRCDSPFLGYMKEDFPKMFPKGRFRRFGDVVKSIHNGENLSKKAYSTERTDYLYLSVAAITRTGIAFSKAINIDDEIGDSVKSQCLEDNQIVMGRSGTHVGRSVLFSTKDSNGKKVIPSGYTMVIDLDSTQANPRYVVAYLNTPSVQKFLVTCSTEKIQRNLGQHYVNTLPFPLLGKKEQDGIAKSLAALDDRRRKLAAELTSLDIQEKELAWNANRAPPED